MKASANTRLSRTDLREKIIQSLRAQGFRIRYGTVLPPKELTKENVRRLHETAVEHRIERAKRGLFRKEEELLQCIASGSEVDPEKIFPRLVEVHRGSWDELLFRYACLHWSIPVSSGYGRRLRFLVKDDHTGKLMGLIGLGVPVFSLRARDEWVGWSALDRRERLSNVMDAFVLGAVPPYSSLLCGKLIAMLATSDTVRNVFKRKYRGSKTIINNRSYDGRLAMITTSSALGRSSIYNRLRFLERNVYQSVGYTKGSGEFHFANGLYAAISNYADRHCEPTAKQERWGGGFRNRREVIRKCLEAVGLSADWIYHGIEREIFVIPLAENTREFLRGEQTRLRWFHQTEAEIFEYFRSRWMMQRSAWDTRYREWSNQDWAIWLPK